MHASAHLSVHSISRDESIHQPTHPSIRARIHPCAFESVPPCSPPQPTLASPTNTRLPNQRSPPQPTLASPTNARLPNQRSPSQPTLASPTDARLPNQRSPPPRQRSSDEAGDRQRWFACSAAHPSKPPHLLSESNSSNSELTATGLRLPDASTRPP
eukprot:353199-Chlamydomonas_euryale.AAC.3